MAKPLVTILGKSVRKIAQLRGGSGSALPGLIVERIDPNFIRDTLAGLPKGIVVISGTNGKTTTTKMVVELLESQNLRVFTNKTGSNFTRGIAAALLGAITPLGRLHADIAVLELDEAHAVHFVKAIQPDHCLLLNVMRDQLDRFGEIDTTANLLHLVAKATKSTVVINRDDPRLASEKFRSELSAKINTYGASDEIKHRFPSDDAMRSEKVISNSSVTFKHFDTELVTFRDQTATISYGDRSNDVTLSIGGIYNVINAVGAIALVRAIVGTELNEQSMFRALAEVKPAFGRGETLYVNNRPLDLILVKNPGGFRLALQSFPPESHATMIAINDNYADGRDMSWLWDVDFESLKKSGVAMVTGVRAYDMTLRLKYELVPVDQTNIQISEALDNFIDQHPDVPKRIYCTYTAMLEIRRLLSKKTLVEKIQ